METFAILVLFGLGVMAVAVLFERTLSLGRDLWALLVLGIGIGLAWVARLDMWAAWDETIRTEWLGITFTGVALAGIAHFWHEILGLFWGLSRKYHDEAQTMEKAEGIRRRVA